MNTDTNVPCRSGGKPALSKPGVSTVGATVFVAECLNTLALRRCHESGFEGRFGKSQGHFLPLLRISEAI